MIVGVILLCLAVLSAVFSFSTDGFSDRWPLWCEIIFPLIFAVAGVLCLIFIS